MQVLLKILMIIFIKSILTISLVTTTVCDLVRKIDENIIFLKIILSELAAREELADTVAELECLKIQSNPSSNTRGNSIFSELEDRRVRAEKLVAKQKAKIGQLRQDLTSARSESRQRMLQFIQEMDGKFNKRDTQIIEDLKAERDRLVLENDRLEATIKVFKDEKLNALREADKFAEAFRPGLNNGKRLIAALEYVVHVFSVAHKITVIRDKEQGNTCRPLEERNTLNFYPDYLSVLAINQIPTFT
ncbi:unnamed protein product [Dibothriocephalus latus]|uniref:Uncharacterized protein n=1 Tax=Dibothriocephalus latus TaxID=60516 RepID=A0A3P7MM46_DIBLA|nr:unnamed protein product [Dibothriocephalus latus]